MVKIIITIYLVEIIKFFVQEYNPQLNQKLQPIYKILTYTHLIELLHHIFTLI